MACVDVRWRIQLVPVEDKALFLRAAVSDRSAWHEVKRCGLIPGV